MQDGPTSIYKNNIVVRFYSIKSLQKKFLKAFFNLIIQNNRVQNFSVLQHVNIEKLK